MKTPKFSAVLLAVPLALGALAAVPATAQPYSPLARPEAAAARIPLTNVDEGRTVTVRPGDDVEVRLTAYRGDGFTYSWEVPQSSAPGVLRSTAGGVTPAGNATAVFHAQGVGSATITAVRHCRPDPGRTCPFAVVPWKVTADVK
ncbi:hypothetical protein ACFWXK_00190 [Streptomyces sp. NPDC059070]|uniref:hypothetical protein n=1 Tax=Streptomyces sp. NPDC059070 TaxID=3346713 RepID=UPI0036BC7AF8